MYDYRRAITNDIKEYIKDNHMEPNPDESYDDYIERLNDELWAEDCITGNGGMYYGSEEECAGYVGYGMREFMEAIEEEFGGITLRRDAMNPYFEAPARNVDCMIRCYLLYECIERAVRELGYEFET